MRFNCTELFSKRVVEAADLSFVINTAMDTDLSDIFDVGMTVKRGSAPGLHHVFNLTGRVRPTCPVTHCT